MRADLFLFKNGYAPSRESARKSIEASLVTVDGKNVTKPSENIDETASHTVECASECPFVSRGGLKLDHALTVFGIDPEGRKCADIGASSGGFTDCLLSHGASKVYAIDSGHGQLASKLLNDPRVVSVEGYNARFLDGKITDGRCGLAVMDVSFISQTLILPRIPLILEEGASAVTLVKPQFEAGRSAVGKGGIVKKSADRKNAALRVAASAASAGLALYGIVRSPIQGGDGNIEYLARFVFTGTASFEDAVRIIDRLEF
ncbi:MAG: TlyA family RNA methyltransferase [Clostridia bacterium]|nr:TlyA family RNA methyltransferase [Clostridia bacterium]